MVQERGRCKLNVVGLAFFHALVWKLEGGSLADRVLGDTSPHWFLGLFTFRNLKIVGMRIWRRGGGGGVG